MAAAEPRGSGRLCGQVAIVTGGTGGIGRAVCRALALEGMRLVIVGRTRGKVQALVTEMEADPAIGSAVPLIGLAMDVRSESDTNAMAQRAVERFGRIDVLVTCAGLGGPTGLGGGSVPQPVSGLPPEAWEEVIDTNLRGVFLSNRAVLPAMLAQRSGQIINVSSARGATAGHPYAAAYCASKFGVLGLSEALAEEVRSFGIRVQVILPDAVHTPLLAGTTLAQTCDDALAASTVADFIVAMLVLPHDTVLVNPLIAPFKPRRRSSPGRRHRAIAGQDPSR